MVIPIQDTYPFRQVREFSKKLAEILTQQYPQLFTTVLTKNKRNPLLFLDYLRNAYGQTSIAPYAIRALPNAPIATPLDWKELTDLTNSQQYTVKNIFQRLSQKPDPWKNFFKYPAKLPDQQQLDQMVTT